MIVGVVEIPDMPNVNEVRSESSHVVSRVFTGVSDPQRASLPWGDEY